MDDDGTYLRHSHLIKGRRPGFGHWLVMRPAEYVGTSDDNNGLPASDEEASIEVGQVRSIHARSRCPAPIAEALDPDPAHSFHRAQVVIMRRDEQQTCTILLHLANIRAKCFPGDASFESPAWDDRGP